MRRLTPVKVILILLTASMVSLCGLAIGLVVVVEPWRPAQELRHSAPHEFEIEAMLASMVKDKLESHLEYASSDFTCLRIKEESPTEWSAFGSIADRENRYSTLRPWQATFRLDDERGLVISFLSYGHDKRVLVH